MKRLILLFCLTVAAFGGLSVPSALADTPPATSTGENLFANTGGPNLVHCNTSGDFTYMVSGVATGPYLGTFTETGTGTVFQPPIVPGSPPFLPPGQFTAFSASFTIYSLTGAVLVRGTKSLDTTIPNLSIACENPPDTGGGNIYASYEATIYTPTGNYRDEGTSFVAVLFTGPSGTLLSEGFASSLVAPVLIVPTDKEQCKHGGWQNYPQFKNQGDCVSFVATGGKNPPGK